MERFQQALDDETLDQCATTLITSVGKGLLVGLGVLIVTRRPGIVLTSGLIGMSFAAGRASKDCSMMFERQKIVDDIVGQIETAVATERD